MPKQPNIRGGEEEAEVDEAERRRIKRARRLEPEAAEARQGGRHVLEAESVVAEADDAKAERKRLKRARRLEQEAAESEQGAGRALSADLVVAEADADKAERKRLKQARRLEREAAEAEQADASRAELAVAEADKAERKRLKQAQRLDREAAEAEQAAGQEEEAEASVVDAQARAERKRIKRAKSPESEAAEANAGLDAGQQAEMRSGGSSATDLHVYVGGLPFSVDEIYLRNKFKTCGLITDATVLTLPNGQSRGIAFITFADARGSNAALLRDGELWMERAIKVGKASGVARKGKGEGKACGGKSKGKGKAGGNVANTTSGSKEFEVFVGGLPYDVVETDFKRHFKGCGSIALIRIPVDRKRKGKGYGFIQFQTQDAFAKALKLHGSSFAGSTLEVRGSSEPKPESDGLACDTREARSRRGRVKQESALEDEADDEAPAHEIFVKHLPSTIKEDGVRKLFEDCGRIKRISMPLTPDGEARGFAFVGFETGEAATSALDVNAREFGGSFLVVKMAGEDNSKGKGKGKSTGSREFEVFVGGLPYTAEEAKIRKDFEECGSFDRFAMPVDEEGNSKGTAFINYLTSEGMEKALNFDGTDYGGLTIRVQKSAAPRGAGVFFARGDAGGKGAGKGKGHAESLFNASTSKSTPAPVPAGKKTTFDSDDDD